MKTNSASFSYNSNVQNLLYAVSNISEHKKYSQSLHQRTIFPYVNPHNFSRITQAVVLFRFRSIEFSKKRALAFFLAVELLTNFKCVASLSNRNVQAWKIRKGMLVGCKVTLRSDALDNFRDTLSLTIPRREKFQPYRNFLLKYYKKKMSSKPVSFFKVSKEAKAPQAFALTLGELVLFYPIELGLGLHPDVQRVTFNFNFSAYTVEERFFLLRSGKIPVLP